jgi:hypothetical protein
MGERKGWLQVRVFLMQVCLKVRMLLVMRGWRWGWGR